MRGLRPSTDSIFSFAAEASEYKDVLPCYTQQIPALQCKRGVGGIIKYTTIGKSPIYADLTNCYRRRREEPAFDVPKTFFARCVAFCRVASGLFVLHLPKSCLLHRNLSAHDWNVSCQHFAPLRGCSSLSTATDIGATFEAVIRSQFHFGYLKQKSNDKNTTRSYLAVSKRLHLHL